MLRFFLVYIAHLAIFALFSAKVRIQQLITDILIFLTKYLYVDRLPKIPAFCLHVSFLDDENISIND
jgi:hypothetical protein